MATPSPQLHDQFSQLFGERRTSSEHDDELPFIDLTAPPLRVEVTADEVRLMLAAFAQNRAWLSMSRLVAALGASPLVASAFAAVDSGPDRYQLMLEERMVSELDAGLEHLDRSLPALKGIPTLTAAVHAQRYELRDRLRGLLSDRDHERRTSR